MVADRLGANQATFAGELAVQGERIRIRRQSDAGAEVIETTLPAVISVTDQTGEARYPAFKAIMMAKKKPVTTLSLSDLDLDASRVGLAAAATSVVGYDKTPPRAAGVVVTDEGEGAAQLADFLQAKGLL
jgi:electron transfer flavoprotein beta subunit